MDFADDSPFNTKITINTTHNTFVRPYPQPFSLPTPIYVAQISEVVDGIYNAFHHKYYPKGPPLNWPMYERDSLPLKWLRHFGETGALVTPELTYFWKRYQEHAAGPNPIEQLSKEVAGGLLSFVFHELAFARRTQERRELLATPLAQEPSHG